MNYSLGKTLRIADKLSGHILSKLKRKRDINSYSMFKKGKRYLKVFMDVNNVCNLNCIMCSRDSKHKAVDMTPEEFKTIGEKCFRYVEKLQISCAWEISISKYSSEILQLLPAFKIPQTSVYTNGNVMNADFMEAVFESGLTEIVFSIGEANARTYSKIRRGGSHSKVLENISILARGKEQRRSKTPSVGANLTCMKSNIHELPDFVKIASDVGVEFIRGRHLILLEGLDMKKESLVDSIEQTNDIIKESREIAKKANMGFYIPLLDKGNQETAFCSKPWNHLYITSNGDLSVCPRISKFVTLGNLLNDDFEKIYYNNNIIENLRSNFIDKNYNEVCRICTKGLVETQEIEQNF